MSTTLQYVGGYCIADQAPVRVYREMVAVDTFGQILQRRRLEREAAAVMRAAQQAAEIGPPTRAQRIASLRQDIAGREQAIRRRDIEQVWGRRTSADYCSATGGDMRRVNDLQALLADAEGGAL